MDITKERLMEILRTFVEIEGESADPYYLREVMEDDIGLTKEEAEAIGIEWVFDVETDEDDD